MDTGVTKKHCSFCGVQGQHGMKFAGGLGAMICRSCVDHFHEVLSSRTKTAVLTGPPWERMSDVEILAALPLIEQTADQVSGFLLDWVELARSRKLSWAQIGKALGVSRQAAWERFADRVDAGRSTGTG